MKLFKSHYILHKYVFQYVFYKKVPIHAGIGTFIISQPEFLLPLR
jgi:hypothetical protein